MTTDDLRPGQPAATTTARSRVVLRPLLALLLAAPALPALAAPEPAPIVPEAIAPAAEVIVPVELELAAPVAASAAAKPAASQLAKQPVVAGAKAPAAPASGLRCSSRWKSVVKQLNQNTPHGLTLKSVQFQGSDHSGAFCDRPFILTSAERCAAEGSLHSKPTARP